MERGKKASIGDQWGIIFVAIFLASVLRINAAPTGGINLVKDDKTNYQILISAQAHPTEAFAAEELQKYIKKMTNVELPILRTDEANIKGKFVFVGNSPMLKGLGIIGEDIDPKDNEDRITNDDFIIKTLKDHLMLVGNDQRGTLYSVYHFLELQGIRFFEPGLRGELVPDKKEIVLTGLDIKEHPRFKYRGINTDTGPTPRVIGELTKATYIDFIDWLAKNKMNWIMYQEGQYGPIGSYSKAEAGAMCQEIKKRSMLLGVNTCNMWQTTPSGQYFPSQYAGLIKGKQGTIADNLCYSSKGAYKDPWGTYEGAEDFVAKKIVQWATTHIRDGVVGEDVIIANLPADCYFPWCGCENCSKEKSGKTGSDWFMETTIKAAREVAKKYPEANVAYSGYSSSGILPPETVFPTKADRNLPILWILQGITRDWYESRSRMTLKEVEDKNPSIMPLIDAWIKYIKKSRMQLDLVYSDGFLLMYFKDAFEVKAIQIKAEDFDYLEEKGVIGVDMQEKTCGNFFPTAQNMRLWARMSWKKTDLTREIEGFYRDYYGEQWENIKEVYNKMDNIITMESTKLAQDLLAYKVTNNEAVCALRDEVLKLIAASTRTDVKWRLNKLYLYLEYIILDQEADSLRKEGKEKEALEVNVRQVELFTKKSEYFAPNDLPDNFWISSTLLYKKLKTVKGLKEYLEAKEGKEVLICGPFPHAGTTPDAKEPAFDIDFLKEQGGEEKIEPKEGMEHTSAIGKVKWQKVKFAGMVDFLKVFNPKENVVGYAFYQVSSPKDQEAKLSIGSDDGYKVWVNHKYVGGLRVFRGAVPRDNEHNIHLKQGDNLILIKVEQDNGGHGFYLEVADSDGKPLLQQ